MTPRRRAASLAAVGLLLAALALAGCASAGSSQSPEGISFWNRDRMLKAHGERAYELPSPDSTPEAKQDARTLRVGALFETDSSGSHFCTASVVESPGRNVIVTAAHCVNDGKGGGNKQHIAFAPGYSDGQAPNGMWTPTKYFMDPHWTNGADDHFDVAFVQLAPQDGKNIQDVIGANKIDFDEGYRHFVRVAGYPATASAPIACWNWTSQYRDYVKFACGGYYGGTSGSPFVTGFGRDAMAGTVVGVLGGYLAGGNTPDVSYSDYLGEDIRKLYQQATAG